ncbi:MAG: hypothetical protein ACKVTZ_24170 [Bacteroidia bacterium]
MNKIWFISACFLFMLGCTNSTDPDPQPDTTPLKESTFTVQNQLNTNAALMMDLYNGKAYNVADAKTNQANIDFIFYQYTGTALNHDCYLHSPAQIKADPTGYGQQQEVDLGINTWTTVNDAIVSTTDVTEATFANLKTTADLVTLYNKNTHTMVNYSVVTDVFGDLQGKVFIFQDNKGRKGYFHIKNITLDTGGSMEIEVKVIK